MSAILCKLCNKPIAYPGDVLIVGISKEQRMMAIAGAVAKHLRDSGEAEWKSLQKFEHEKNGHGIKLPPRAPHHQAISEVMQQGINVSALVRELEILKHFELTEDLVAYRNQHLSNIHNWSRRVRMSDEELAQLAKDHNWTFASEGLRRGERILDYNLFGDLMFLLRDLRDRYEEIGKYAPAQPAPSVKL